jgi:hypothetical protein
MVKEVEIAGVEMVSDFGDDGAHFVIGTCGPGGAGKSRLAVSGPDLTAIIPTDRKTRHTVEAAMREYGKKFGTNILLPKEDLVSSAVNPVLLMKMDEKQIKELYRAKVDRIKDIVWSFYSHDDVRLICIDSFGQLCKDIEFALYGRDGHRVKRIGGNLYKDKSEAAQEVIDFINSISGKFLILTHKGKAEYKNDKATGRWTWEGFKYLANHCEVILEQESNPKWNPDSDKEDEQWQWAATFQQCQSNTQLQATSNRRVLTDEMITFEQVAALAFPDTDPSLYT